MNSPTVYFTIALEQRSKPGIWLAQPRTYSTAQEAHAAGVATLKASKPQYRPLSFIVCKTTREQVGHFAANVI